MRDIDLDVLMKNKAERDSAYHLNLLVDHIPSMLAYWDKDLLCRYANRAYLRWFGVAPEKLIGTSLRDLLGPQLFAQNEPHINAVLRGEEQVFERIVPGPDGVRRHSLATYIPDIADGVVIGFLVQVTEVTKLKETEAALQREQVLRAQVEQHARELNRLLRERDDMLDVLAHEVRQPLNNASAALQSAAMALSQLGEEFASSRLARAQEVMGQVLASIDNTLAVATSLSRSSLAQLEDTDVDTLVAVAIADMSTADRDRIRVERATTTRTVSVDMSLMRLALRNLLSNALKFSPPGSWVTVRIADSDNPLALLLDVEDCGPGFDVASMPELFQRGARSQRSSASGLGLGLYIVRRVMELHGGSVSLVRNGRTGATMRLVIVQNRDLTVM